jgi:hypothetical protein
VETNFDAFVFQGYEESIDVVGASVGRSGIEEPGRTKRSATIASPLRAFCLSIVEYG